MYDEEQTQRTELWEALGRAPASVVREVTTLLRSVGMVVEHVDLMDVPRDLLAALHWAVTRSLLLPDEVGQRMRWYVYKKQLTTTFYNAVEWIRHRRAQTMTPQLSNKIIQCRANGWPVHRIVYVRPSRHYGASIGDGVFAMIHLRRGHLLFQFTGKVVPGGKCYIAKTLARQNYCIECRYGGDEYTVDPLTRDERAAHPAAVSAHINEPSPPPWRMGDLARVGRHNVRIARAYDYRTGTYGVEYAKGETATVSAVDLDAHPAHPAVQRVFEANVLWYDFPVPLDELYAPNGVVVASGGKKLGADPSSSRAPLLLPRYRRTRARTTTLRWRLPIFLKEFTGFSDTTGVFKMERRIATDGGLAAGHMVYMRDGVFPGLERYGVVMRTDATSVTVQHAVTANTLWRLPRTVLAGKAHRCPACARSDDPTCTRCSVVPFPLVYACKDIHPGQELLCLYSTRTRLRGLPCRAPLQDADLLPRWDDH